ncbi:retrovirus-related Pol polyprotein from transposon opus [Nephila pilipes]|uniref:Retrovirus-related Pol polyprotein from transposon opus n=1 Tax=Nephila pilipes TaxID=299642 RepID=A0A8X6UMS7_NEPPI|nr:retrovirus-related Pol polyprotein from transposon opus [Nephila pilipes]
MENSDSTIMGQAFYHRDRNMDRSDTSEENMIEAESGHLESYYKYTKFTRYLILKSMISTPISRKLTYELEDLKVPEFSGIAETVSRLANIFRIDFNYLFDINKGKLCGSKEELTIFFLSISMKLSGKPSFVNFLLVAAFIDYLIFINFRDGKCSQILCFSEFCFDVLHKRIFNKVFLSENVYEKLVSFCDAFNRFTSPDSTEPSVLQNIPIAKDYISLVNSCLIASDYSISLTDSERKTLEDIYYMDKNHVDKNELVCLREVEQIAKTDCDLNEVLCARCETVDTVASSAAEEVLGRKSRLFVRDRTTGCKFLVDSGADVSIIPVSKDLTKPNLTNRVVKHDIEHHIEATGQPVYSRARQLAPDKLQCKFDLAKAALLAFPKSGLPLSLCADASDFPIGSLLQQYKFRLQIFQLIHGFAHSGVKSTIKLMTEKYVWSNLKKQVREWAKECIRCQKCKVTRHTKSKFDEYQASDERFSVVHIDLIGPLPPSEGMMYCLTYIDRFSCRIEVVPLPDITAKIVGKAFYEHWICRFGVPATIITDQGRQFESKLFRKIAAICGAKVVHTTPYHPQCDGKVERLHRTLKKAIKAYNNIKWTESLPTVLLGLRAALRPDINHTIAQMVYGTYIKLPGEFFDQPAINMDPQNFVTKLQQHMEDIKPLKPSSTRKQKSFVLKELESCLHVIVRIDSVKKKLLNHHMKAHLLW